MFRSLNLSSVWCYLTLLVFGQADVRSADQPNVLMIVTDEHNFRTLGCYRKQMTRQQAEMWGKGVVVETPFIDRIADEGVICTRAYATSPVCSPCRAALFTGRYPHQVGVPTNNEILDRTVPSIADRLNEEGYRTGYLGKWHLAGNGKPEWGPAVDGGFQFTKFMFNRGHWKKFDTKNGRPFVAAESKGKPSYGIANADESTFSTDFLTDRAIEFMIDDSEKKPFFSVISYPDPHGPNTVRKPYDSRFSKLPFEKPRTNGTGLPTPGWLSGGSSAKHPPFRGEQMAKYFGMVQCIDDNIGKLLNKLEESGQLANTLIVFTSDHGDLCYEHDRLNKGNPYEGSARVPMIFRLPGTIASGKVYSEAFGSVDVTPTVIGLLGLKANKNDTGRNLAEQLKKPQSRSTESESGVTILRNSGKTASWMAAVDGRFKLILSANDEPWVFDREQDPDELINYFRRPGTEGVAERLAAKLREYGERTNDPHLKQENIAATLEAILNP